MQRSRIPFTCGLPGSTLYSREIATVNGFPRICGSGADSDGRKSAYRRWPGRIERIIIRCIDRLFSARFSGVSSGPSSHAGPRPDVGTARRAVAATDFLSEPSGCGHESSSRASERDSDAVRVSFTGFDSSLIARIRTNWSAAASTQSRSPTDETGRALSRCGRDGSKDCPTSRVRPVDRPCHLSHRTS